MSLHAAPLLGNVIVNPNGMALAEWTDDGRPLEGPMAVAPLHLHERCDEAWYVQEGRLVVRSGDEEVTLNEGDAVIVPAGTPHTYWNPDPAPCRYLLVMSALTWRLIQAIHATSDRSSETMRKIFTDHGARLL